MDFAVDHIVQELVQLLILESSADQFDYFNVPPLKSIKESLEVNFFEVAVE